ncbi:unnamed protein product [Trichogramma brassicae]|uniref:Uncharacterized protein n=1 Tax=Trichogramma brassicae TaxID=86971 RepID=A0A6H5HX13_9HYME|nr:unnamed protein product [Trichogramma brassicae]
MSDQPANSASEVPRGSENVNPQENIPASNNTPTNGNANNAPTNGNATTGGHPIPGRDAYAAAVRSDRIRFSADLGELSINFGGERRTCSCESEGDASMRQASVKIKLYISAQRGCRNGRPAALQTKETKEKSPKKVNFSDSPDHQETEDELNDQWFSEMKEISLRKEALLQNQLEVAAENQRLMQEMIAEQRNLRAAQEAAQASQEKLRKEQAEATKKLNKISSTLEAILLDSRQQQADKENDPGIEAEKPKRTEREIKEKQPKVNAATVPPIEEIVCYRCTESKWQSDMEVFTDSSFGLTVKAPKITKRVCKLGYSEILLLGEAKMQKCREHFNIDGAEKYRLLQARHVQEIISLDKASGEDIMMVLGDRVNFRCSRYVAERPRPSGAGRWLIGVLKLPRRASQSGGQLNKGRARLRFGRASLRARRAAGVGVRERHRAERARRVDQ